jgi:hypothetical protein
MTRRLLLAAALLAALLLAAASTLAQGPSQPRLVCDRGPFGSKTFGGTPWQIYGCNDNRSVAIVTAPGSPALPFYFLLAWVNGVYTVSGEGTGAREFTAKAYAEIVKLNRQQIDALVNETLKKN